MDVIHDSIISDVTITSLLHSEMTFGLIFLF